MARLRLRHVENGFIVAAGKKEFFCADALSAREKAKVFVMAREMKIGIASFKDFKKRTISIASGAYQPNNNEPTVWFDSIESMAQVLSSKNQELLKKIRDNNPESLAELAVISGRQVSNLSRTLKNMEKYGIVELNKGKESVKPLLRKEVYMTEIAPAIAEKAANDLFKVKAE